MQAHKFIWGTKLGAGTPDYPYPYPFSREGARTPEYPKSCLDYNKLFSSHSAVIQVIIYYCKGSGDSNNCLEKLTRSYLKYAKNA